MAKYGTENSEYEHLLCSALASILNSLIYSVYTLLNGQIPWFYMSYFIQDFAKNSLCF